ncbi:VOC family protein [Sulfitobacter sp. JB4-11]|uniref:VOC family protein n=1 Tax=Sulfitobacter rhodophyticola TaxID=3238304 RepID=UPI0035154869
MPQDTTNIAVHALDHLVLTVKDIPTTVQFYQDVLGMQAESFITAAGEVRQALRFGQAKINLHQKGQEFEPKAASPMPGSADLCFLTNVPLPRWQQKFATQGIEVEEGPVPRTGATGPLMSLYIRDPDGNLIEVSTS